MREDAVSARFDMDPGKFKILVIGSRACLDELIGPISSPNNSHLVNLAGRPLQVDNARGNIEQTEQIVIVCQRAAT